MRALRSALLAATTSVLLVTAIQPAAASVAKGSGKINVGHPATTVLGVTEAAFYKSKCESKALDGIDARIVKLSGANFFSAEGYGPTGVRVPLSVAFYTADCRWIQTVPSENNMVADFTVPNSGPWPASGTWRDGSSWTAAWAVVSAPYGAYIDAKWALCSSPQECKA